MTLKDQVLNADHRRPFTTMQIFDYTHEKITNNIPTTEAKDDLLQLLESKRFDGKYVIYGPENGDPYWTIVTREELDEIFEMDRFDDLIRMYQTQPVKLFIK